MKDVKYISHKIGAIVPILAISLSLCACATVPPPKPPDPKPAVLVFVEDCDGIEFVVAVDDHGKYVVIGGNAPNTPEQIQWAHQLFADIDPKDRIHIHMGECSGT